MDWFGDASRLIHVAFGSVALAAFWIPVLTRKGSTIHRRAGRVFVYCAYVVLAAAALSLISTTTTLIGRGATPRTDPATFGFIVFLAYLALVTFVAVRHGAVVLEHKGNRLALRTPLNRGLARSAIAASAVLVVYALVLSPPIWIILLSLSPIGFMTGYDNLNFIDAEEVSPRAWMYEHLGNMLGSGIAFHTAFAVFGARQLFEIGLSGWHAVIPWIAPTLIGIPAITIWTSKLKRRFGESS